ncbi:hypothetical protein H4I95_03674 [Botrytis cinerea]
MSDFLPTVPSYQHPATSATEYKITTPATTDPSLSHISTSENPILHPRKFDLESDTEFVAGAVAPAKGDALQTLDLGFGFPSAAASASASRDAEEKYRAAYSVHFGPKSRYNTTGKVKEVGSKVEMQKIAELAAACEALEFVESQCKMRVTGFEDVSGEIVAGGFVVGVTSSTNLWYGITEHIYKWKRNDFHNSKGSKVIGEDLWRRIDECMNRFEFNQTRVAWLLCEKEDNEAYEAAQKKVAEI